MTGSRRRLNASINVVPYIDVMLVLLIIFMVTAPLITTGVQVDLPKAAANPIDQAHNEPVQLTVDAKGNLYLDIGSNTDKPVSPQQVVLMTKAVLTRKPNTPVVVRADGSVPYSKVVQAMVLLQQAGADKVGLVTQPPPNQKS